MRGLIPVVALLAHAASALPTPFNEINRALFVAAHPDDIATAAGGLVATLVSKYNVSVAYLVATLGQAGWNKGYNITRDQVGQIRRQEQLNAAAVLGVEEVFFLDQQDGFLEGVDPVQLKVNVTQVIRTWRPDVLITFSDQIDYPAYRYGMIHRDHLTIGRAALDAAYPMARDFLAAPTLWPQFPTWDTPQVWLFSWEQVSSTDLLLDISDVFQLKFDSLSQHKSQYTNATALYENLQDLGQLVADKNNYGFGAVAEAYTVVEIL